MLYLNGKIISEKDAAIDPNDRGFLLGDGLFETIRCEKGQALELEAHWSRLSAGAQFLKLPLPITCNEACHILSALLRANHLSTLAAARITVTRGAGPRGIHFCQDTTPTILINTFAFKNKKTPLRVTISEFQVNEQSPLTKFKTLCYLDNIMARQHAIEHGFDDAILLNTQGHLVCATAANLFFVKDGVLCTPAVEEGALPGIERQRVLDSAIQQGEPVCEGCFSVDDLLSAQKVFITNSLIGQQAVAQIHHPNLATA